MNNAKHNISAQWASIAASRHALISDKARADSEETGD